MDCTKCRSMQRRFDEAEEDVAWLTDCRATAPARDKVLYDEDIAKAKRAREVAAAGLQNHRGREHGVWTLPKPAKVVVCW